jgi:hypothetical protein
MVPAAMPGAPGRPFEADTGLDNPAARNPAPGDSPGDAELVDCYPFTVNVELELEVAGNELLPAPS